MRSVVQYFGRRTGLSPVATRLLGIEWGLFPGKRQRRWPLLDSYRFVWPR